MLDSIYHMTSKFYFLISCFLCVKHQDFDICTQRYNHDNWHHFITIQKYAIHLWFCLILILGNII